MSDEGRTETDCAVRAANLRFSWRQDRPVIDIPEFHVDAGECLFLRGPSGSGKSTLLGLICGVLVPNAGELDVLGQNMARLSAAQRDALRANQMGVIFQLFNLVPYLSVLDNVMLPCRFSRQREQRAMAHDQALVDEARRLCARLGLGDTEIQGRSVHELSVGQQQRVAAARALIGRPGLVIADEPTSALDADSRDAFLSLLLEECRAHHASLIFVSHDSALGRHFDREVDLAHLNQARVSEDV